jgi:replication-associated recombination protein RarA
MFEVVSALQKDIRRGLEENAMYWGLEFLPLYEKYLWKRLITIAHEDIGLADVGTVQFVTSQCESWFTLRSLGAQDECRLLLANVIMALCRAPKSRLADHFQCVVTTEWQMHKHEIPDYALDKHTLRGSQMGRGMAFFITNEDKPTLHEPDDPYKGKAESLWMAGKPDRQAEWPMPKPPKPVK